MKLKKKMIKYKNKNFVVLGGIQIGVNFQLKGQFNTFVLNWFFVYIFFNLDKPNLI